MLKYVVLLFIILVATPLIVSADYIYCAKTSYGKQGSPTEVLEHDVKVLDLQPGLIKYKDKLNVTYVLMNYQCIVRLKGK